MADCSLDDIIKSSNFNKGKNYGHIGSVNRGRGSFQTRGRGASRVLVKRLQDARNLLNFRINTALRQGDARKVIAQRMKGKIVDARQLMRNKQSHSISAGPVVLPTVKVVNDQYQKPAPPVIVRHLKQLTGGNDFTPRGKAIRGIGPSRMSHTRNISVPRIHMTNQFNSTFSNPAENEALELERVAAAQEVLRRHQERLQAQQMASGMHAPLHSLQQQHLQMSYGHNMKTNHYEQIKDVSGGYRVKISNLHPNVTKEDVFELFTSIGPLRHCSKVVSGSAEVVFSKKEDALLAFRRYDKRELDGQPMHLTLLDNTSKLSGGQNLRFQFHPDVDSVRSALYPSNSSNNTVNFHVSI